MLFAMLKIAVLLLLATSGLCAQSRRIDDHCANASLEAVQALDNALNSAEATAAMRDQVRSCDFHKEYEIGAVVMVRMFQDVRKHTELPTTCKEGLEEAFRNNVMPDFPRACFSSEFEEFKIASRGN